MTSLVEAAQARRQEEQIAAQRTLAAGHCACGAPMNEGNSRGECFRCWKATRAAPAEETPVADEKRTCSKEGCTNKLGGANKSGVCSACSSRYKPRTAGVAKAALQTPAVPSAPPVAGEQPIEDVIRSRLEHHRARVKELLHHQTEAAKLERALAALMEVNLP